MRSTNRLSGACISTVRGAEETSAVPSALGGRAPVVTGSRPMGGSRTSLDPQGVSTPQGGGPGSIQDVLKATQTLEKVSRDEIAMVRHDLKMHVDNTASILRDITAALEAERQSRKTEFASMTAKVHDVLGQAAAGIRAELDAAAKVGDKSQALVLSLQQDMLDKVEASQRNSDALVERITGVVLTRLNGEASAHGTKEATPSTIELKDDMASLAARSTEIRLELGQQLSSVEARLEERVAAMSDSLRDLAASMLSRQENEQLQREVAQEGEARQRDVEVLQRGIDAILLRVESTESVVNELAKTSPTPTPHPASLPAADVMEGMQQQLEQLLVATAASREQQASACSELDSQVKMCTASLESQASDHSSLARDVKDMHAQLATLESIQTQLAQLTRDVQKNSTATEVCQEEMVAGLANLSQSTSKEMSQLKQAMARAGIERHSEVTNSIEVLRAGYDDLLSRCSSTEVRVQEMSRPSPAEVEKSVPAAALEGLQQQLEELRTTVAANLDQHSAAFGELDSQVRVCSAAVESQAAAQSRLSNNFVELAKTAQAQQGETISKMQGAMATEMENLKTDVNGRVADVQAMVKSKDIEHSKDLQSILDRLNALQDIEDAKLPRADFRIVTEQVQGLSDALAAVQVRSQTMLSDVTVKLSDLGSKVVARENEQMAFAEQLRAVSTSVLDLQDKLANSTERRLDFLQNRIADSQKAATNNGPVAKEHLSRCLTIEESVQKLQLALQAEEGKRLEGSMVLKKQIDACSAMQGRHQEEMAEKVANFSSEISTMSSGLTSAEEKLSKLFESDAASQVGLPMMGRKVQDVSERLATVTNKVTVLIAQHEKMESVCVELQEHATQSKQRHLQLTDLRHLLSAEVESRQAACNDLQESVQRSAKAVSSVEQALPDLRSQVHSLTAWSHEAKAIMSELIRQSGSRSTVLTGSSTERREHDAASPSSTSTLSRLSPTTPRRHGDKQEPLIAGGLESAYRAGTSTAGTSSSPLSGTAKARTDTILRSLSHTTTSTQLPNSSELPKERTSQDPSDYGGKKVDGIQSHSFRRFKDANAAEPLPPPPAPLSLPPSVANPPSWSSSTKFDDKGQTSQGPSTWNWRTHIVEANELDQGAAAAGRQAEPRKPETRDSARERSASRAKAEAYKEGGLGEDLKGTGSQNSAWYAQFLPSWYGQMDDR